MAWTWRQSPFAVPEGRTIIKAISSYKDWEGMLLVSTMLLRGVAGGTPLERAAIWTVVGCHVAGAIATVRALAEGTSEWAAVRTQMSGCVVLSDNVLNIVSMELLLR